MGHGGFYQPGYRNGAKIHLQMLCLENFWDPETKSYEEFRSIDGAKPPTIPAMFKKLVGEAIRACHSIIRDGSIRNPADEIPSMEPDISIFSFFAQSGKL
ncbi:hypothetical protein AQUCO_00400477v1 [Aquilegia coerulea]|uniref:Uncharacterized protein n=1 Tax=Aquilegia coerulea TaxID=218851 RepID=A0A2G5EV65_AQUCA|nr:hypothetical protein AQUCO_00400477v1 [Aquilegia coerulea]